MALLRIPTTQNVTLEYETASVGERIAATLLDLVIMLGWVIAWVLINVYLLQLDTNGPGNGSTAFVIFIFALVLLPLFLYHLLSEVFFQGQSIGKKALKIRVISLNGAPPRFTQYLLRWVLRLVDIDLIYGVVAMACILGSGRGQRLGDMAAGTAVVRLNRRSVVADNALFGADYDPLYRVTYPEVAQLADHDVRLIQELVTQSEQRGAYHILADVAQRVRQLTGIQTHLPDHEFLLVVLRDYAHLAGQTAER
ncbi:RDD family protein [Hymenobacter jeollabukensis]|uniref:RDD family protein n=1 Tax=Hymenobacter jeollabukensis TaxID=2025313 RepID=A0A5R8WLY7_9BACT|nr:RDD family protein [Hymenobacter jeollabukensis]TLM89978.1 RDD family protein [Hymenobacter jeollabukensis]